MDALKKFSSFWFASPEIIGVKFCNRRMDRQTDKFFDTIYGGVWFFLSVKFANSLLASLAGGKIFIISLYFKTYLGHQV